MNFKNIGFAVLLAVAVLLPNRGRAADANCDPTARFQSWILDINYDGTATVASLLQVIKLITSYGFHASSGDGPDQPAASSPRQPTALRALGVLNPSGPFTTGNPPPSFDSYQLTFDSGAFPLGPADPSTIAAKEQVIAALLAGYLSLVRRAHWPGYGRQELVLLR